MTDHVQSDSERIAEVERQLLGCVMQPDDSGWDALDDAAELLTPSDFSVHAHQLVFETCLELRAANAPVTPVAIFERLSSAGKISELGAEPAVWLADRLTNGITGHARYYAGLVRESSDRRRFRHAAAEIAHIANESKRPAADSIAEAEQILFGLTDTQKFDQVLSAGQLARDGLEKIDERIGREEPHGVQTGFPDIDFFLGGLKSGNLVVVGARPSAGKTALAITIATNAANSGTPVHFASLEMSRTEITDRIFSMKSGVPLKAIQSGRMPDGRRLVGEQIDRIQAAADDFRESLFYLDDNSNLTAARLASIVRRGVRRKGIKLVIVDYLQLMYPESEKRSPTSPSWNTHQTNQTDGSALQRASDLAGSTQPRNRKAIG